MGGHCFKALFDVLDFMLRSGGIWNFDSSPHIVLSQAHINSLKGFRKPLLDGSFPAKNLSLLRNPIPELPMEYYTKS